ncbi:hypothetical protein V1511DRAFT_491920 [Dipodascopsis uninucleata]
MAFTLRWGIVATGAISSKFFKDLLIDPMTRGVADIVHMPVAVASRSKEKAEEFIKANAPGVSGIKAYGSYAELYADPAVDCVYIGSPHSMHYPNTLEALKAGKNVLCEKPFTINAAQTKHLIQIAKENRVFLMEGVWTRFFPLTLAFQKLIHEDKVIGKIRRVFTDLAETFPKNDPNIRLYDPKVGGGAQLDLGVYSVTWALLSCFHAPENEKSMPSSIKASMLKSSLTSVDESSSVTMLWDKAGIISVASSSMMVTSPSECLILVQGDKGDVIVPIHSSRPEKIIVKLHGAEPKTYDFPIPGWGLFWEADAVARDIRDGKLEDSLYPLSESVFEMEILDECRRQNGLEYPVEIEKVM